MAKRFLFRARILRRGQWAAEPTRRQGQVLPARGGAAAVARFDARFGEGLLATVPMAPGTYVYRDAAGAVLYVGRARNLRARLRQYRHATAGARGRRMRGIVAEAQTLTWEVAGSELEAALRELALIQSLRPSLNISGAFFTHYPFWGHCLTPDGRVALCHTAAAETATDFELAGAWRSRGASTRAFEALMRLLSMLGHPEPGRRARTLHPLVRGRVVVFRQLRGDVIAGLPAFLRGERDDWLVDLSLGLLERTSARRRSETVQADLRILAHFLATEIAPLKGARTALSYAAWPVPQAARDPLMLEARAQGATSAGGRGRRGGGRRMRVRGTRRTRGGSSR
jgi:hypothetical protein